MVPYRLQIYLDPAVRDALRALALQERTTLQALVSRWLIERLAASGHAPGWGSGAGAPALPGHAQGQEPAPRVEHGAGSGRTVAA